MRNIRILTGIAALLGLPAASPPSEPESYRCSAKATLPDGEIEADRWVDSEGRDFGVSTNWYTLTGPYPQFAGNWFGEPLDRCV